MCEECEADLRGHLADCDCDACIYREAREQTLRQVADFKIRNGDILG